MMVYGCMVSGNVRKELVGCRGSTVRGEGAECAIAVRKDGGNDAKRGE